MSKLLRTFQRIGKRAVKYEVDIIYRELELTCVERWQPHKLVINWSHHSRNEHTSPHSLEPSIAQPSRGYVRWPPTGERNSFTITLYFDPFVDMYEDKHWILSINEMTRSGELRSLAKLRVSINDLAVSHTSAEFARKSEALTALPLSEVTDVQSTTQVIPESDLRERKLVFTRRILELHPLSSRVTSAKLTIDARVSADPTELDAVQPLPPLISTAFAANQDKSATLRRSGMQRFSTRIRETFRRRRAPGSQSVRLPVQSASMVRTSINEKTGSAQDRTSFEPDDDLVQSHASDLATSHHHQLQKVEVIDQSESINSCNNQSEVIMETEATIAPEYPSKTSVFELANHEQNNCMEQTVPSQESSHIEPLPTTEPVTCPATTIDAENTGNSVNGHMQLQTVSTVSLSAEASSTLSVTAFDPVNTQLVKESVSEQELLGWCKSATAWCSTVLVNNLFTSFRNGCALCAIIQHHRPDLMDVSKLNKSDIVENNRRAFDLANRYFDIAPAVEPSTMIGDGWKQPMIDYLKALRKYFIENPVATQRELELLKAESLARGDAQLGNGVSHDDEDDLFELQNAALGSANEESKRVSSGSSKKGLFNAIKKRSSSSLHKLLGRPTSEHAASGDADESEKRKSTRAEAAVADRPAEVAIESPHLTVSSSVSAHSLTVSETVGYAKQRESSSTLPQTPTLPNKEQTETLLTPAKQDESPALATPSEDGSSANLPTTISPTDHKRLSKSEEDGDLPENLADKRQQRNSKVIDASANSRPTVEELLADLNKVEGEMRDVDTKLAIVEARLREIMTRRAQTMGRQSVTPAEESVSTKLGKLGRAFSLRRPQVDVAAQRAAAQAAADAERDEKLLVKQQVALTNHKDLLVLRQDHINLLLQNDELEKKQETINNQLQEYSELHDWQKTDEQRLHEEQLTEEKLLVVSKRNQIVLELDENEQRIEEASEREEEMRNLVLDSAHAEQCVIS